MEWLSPNRCTIPAFPCRKAKHTALPLYKPDRYHTFKGTHNFLIRVLDLFVTELVKKRCMTYKRDLSPIEMEEMTAVAACFNILHWNFPGETGEGGIYEVMSHNI